MRIALIIIIGIHGLIHLFGFLKAFGFAEFDQLSQAISKSSGILWLLSFLLFAISILLMLLKSDYWWMATLLAVIVSQVLIFSYWSDAKYGTVANLIILLASIVAYANFSFLQQVKEERTMLFEQSESISQDLITEESISQCPPIIQKWLRSSGMVGRSKISNVYLQQELDLKLKPEQADWTHGSAEQYFSIQPPAFNWSINTNFASIFNVVGRDKFQNGKGEMIIKLLSLIPVADAKNHEKIDQGSLQRYLAEIVWFPSAALSEYIQWESIDSLSARATMEYGGTKGSGTFYFNEDGSFKKFSCMRYQDSKSAEPARWTVIATRSETRNGIMIPLECEVNWEIDKEDWCWLKLKITDIEYNLDSIPIIQQPKINSSAE